MEKKEFASKLEKIPVPVLATLVGAATLSNVYLSLDFPIIRHITMIFSTFVLLLYIAKIIFCFDTCVVEYKTTVFCSLYAGFTMLLMILGSYYYAYAPTFGRILWFIGMCIHIVHIIVFSVMHVFRGVKRETFVPSWFVTYNGLLVSAVVGGTMNANGILKWIVYYGIAIYAIILPFLVYRLLKHEILPQMYHTLAVVLAPCSLCVVGYLNVIENPNIYVVSILYVCVVASLLFIFYKIPKFFAVSFTPGFAGLTFPMAIGIVASSKAGAFFAANGYETLGLVIKQMQGIQIFVTTFIIAFVVYNFIRMLLPVFLKKGQKA